ncbi:MAG TPA: YezD family protein [Thermodesulfobacteriota bacterium]|nr:YezD family protein [Thermodesulfobacteriota bacterium]
MDQDIIEFKESEKAFLFQILKGLRSIRYGYVQITVQDSKVVQIDKMEKTRFDKTDSYILKEEWGI